MYKGLAQIYVDDPRFRESYDPYRQGFADYLKKQSTMIARTRYQKKSILGWSWNPMTFSHKENIVLCSRDYSKKNSNIHGTMNLRPLFYVITKSL